MSEKPTALVDVNIPAPEGFGIKEVKILADAQAMNYVEQYRDALMVARSIPFDIEALNIADPLALVIANQYKNLTGVEAVRRAKNWYSSWVQEANADATMLAFLAVNTFSNTPTPYVEQKTAPGIPTTPRPRYDLSDPVEHRLKQIKDMLASDITFQGAVMNAINNAIATLVRGVTGDTDAAGFQPTSVDQQVSKEDVTNSEHVGDRPENGAAS